MYTTRYETSRMRVHEDSRQAFIEGFVYLPTVGPRSGTEMPWCDLNTCIRVVACQVRVVGLEVVIEVLSPR